MRQKKNKFFTFIFSLLPGAAEMYMGFMKTGISLMAIFFLSLMIPSIFHMSDVFIFLAVLIWFYGFFHARSLASYEEGPLYELEDEYIWNFLYEGKKLEIASPTIRKWAAGILICFGVFMLWETLEDVLYMLIPRHLWNTLSPVVELIPELAVSVLIILIGVKLIMGKKEELDGSEK